MMTLCHSPGLRILAITTSIYIPSLPNQRYECHLGIPRDSIMWIYTFAIDIPSLRDSIPVNSGDIKLPNLKIDLHLVCYISSIIHLKYSLILLMYSTLKQLTRRPRPYAVELFRYECFVFMSYTIVLFVGFWLIVCVLILTTNIPIYNVLVLVYKY